MQLQDNDFFEEYKRLDRLCSDMYSCQNGISEYIAQMENNSNQGRCRVSSWESDYKTLKHVRWVRNQIAHDSGSCQISEPEDLTFVLDFYDRIFSGQDSLTLLRKAIEAEAERQRQQKKQQANQVSTPTVPRPDAPSEEESRDGIGVLIGIVAAAFILMLLFFIR